MSADDRRQFQCYSARVGNREVVMGDRRAEEWVREFYESTGWRKNGGVTKDAELWEDLRPVAADYVRVCRRRLLLHIPKEGRFLLDAGSGPIQYPEYLEYSRRYRKRFCVDLSRRALVEAKSKVGDHGECVLSSILSPPFPDSLFDCTLSLHTIYHIDRSEQETAERELSRVTRSGRPVVVVYTNPSHLLSLLKTPLRALGWVSDRFRRVRRTPVLYVYGHPLRWWSRFRDVATVRTFPWRSLIAADTKRLVPESQLGRWLLHSVFHFERRLPDLVVRVGAHPVIVLRKRRLGLEDAHA